MSSELAQTKQDIDFGEIAKKSMASGRPGVAVSQIMKAIVHDPDNDQYKRLFVHWIRGKNISGDYVTLKKVLKICLADPNIMRPFLLVLWLTTITKEKDFRVLQEIADCDTYKIFENNFTEADLKPILQDSLLIAGLPVFYVIDPRLEKALTYIRRYFLENLNIVSSYLNFVSALNLHCFQNEYVFSVQSSERELYSELQNSVHSCDLKSVNGQALVALYGCYCPLIELNNASNICELINQEENKYYCELIKRQISDHLEEKRLMKNIAVLTTIQDSTSEAVRDQYESNPYPRWHSWQKPLVDNSGLQDDAGKVILNAGCGTGRSPISTATVYKNAKITGVDLSLASLAYAKRTAEEMNLKNINFIQADILELEEWDNRFDMIVSSGVLHHLKEPIEGWRVLTKLLKPGGVMNIGLYSKRGRRVLIAGQDWIKKKNLPSTNEGVRELREHVFSCEKDDPIKGLMGMYDFYSLSNCRDLLFHVMEHQFSCLDLKSMMDTLGLKFLGFKNLHPEVKKRYRKKFPDDLMMIDLEMWDELENELPQSFVNMYHFFCCRKNERPNNELPSWLKIKLR